MRELVGKCAECDRDVYCQSGFLDGVIENGQLKCFGCAKKDK